MIDEKAFAANKVIIDWSNFEEYSSVPIEYRFVDRCEVVPGKEAFGMKAVSSGLVF